MPQMNRLRPLIVMPAADWPMSPKPMVAQVATAMPDDRQKRRRPQALVERAHDRAVRAEAHEERADDRGHDAGTADRQRVDHDAFDDVVPAKKIAPSTMVATTVTA